MPSLYDTAALRTAEARELARLEPLALMRRAARALSDVAAEIARGRPPRSPIIALVGPGNNGADALLAAADLRDRGFAVQALPLTRQPPGSRDAREAWSLAESRGLPIIERLTPELAGSALVIDGLFGIGLSRPITGTAAAWIGMLNDAHAQVIAVDVPSGINADSGAVVGGHQGVAVRAQTTVTFLGDKPGLHTGAGRLHAGRVQLQTLAVDAGRATGTLVTAHEARELARPLHRQLDSHKGVHGHVAIVGGSRGLRGAAVLAALGAQCCGAGKVSLGSPDGWQPDPGLHPELMSLDLTAPVGEFESWVVGCGLGQRRSVRLALRAILSMTQSPLVIDADALNLISVDPRLALAARQRSAPTVLTPHPLEAARLLGVRTDQVQADRIAAATALAKRFGSIVVLKGAGTVCADRAGNWAVIDAGSPSLATAGTGDVLAGVIGGLIAQGTSVASAACLGAWVHARAGELAAEHRGGVIGMAASALPAWVGDAMNSLTTHKSDLRS